MARTKRVVRRTSTVTLDADELTALARLLGAGKVMLQRSFPVMGKLKAAMTRLGIPTTGL